MLRPSPYLSQVTSWTLCIPVQNYSPHLFHSKRIMESHNLTSIFFWRGIRRPSISHYCNGVLDLRIQSFPEFDHNCPQVHASCFHYKVNELIQVTRSFGNKWKQSRNFEYPPLSSSHLKILAAVRGHLSQPTLPIRTTGPDVAIPVYIPPHKHNPHLVWTWPADPMFLTSLMFHSPSSNSDLVHGPSTHTQL